MKSFIVILFFTVSLFGISDEVRQYMKTLEVEALKENQDFKGFNASRGEIIFTSKHIGKKGKEISCTSCHTSNLRKNGENFFTSKLIEPLSDSVNPKRLSSVKTVKKWLRRNFKDVYKREGTAQEKGDVLTYIMKY